MTHRRMLTAAIAAAAVVGLAACGPDNSSESAAPASTAAVAATGGASAAPSGAPTTTPGKASKAPSKAPTKAGSGTPGTDGEPEQFCDAAALPAGHKIVFPSKATATGMSAKDSEPRCGVNDVMFAPVGADKAYQFAAGVKAQLRSVMVPPKDVNAAELATHITECVAHKEKPGYPCTDGDYEITVDAAGKITEILERPHS